LVKRYNKESKTKEDILFPNAITTYNQFMGRIDLHDMYCNRVMPIVRSKKWTWIILVRIIQSSITNETILWNTACVDERKLAIKDFAISIAKNYMTTKSKRSKIHKINATAKFGYCSDFKKCGKRTYNFCETCELYFCLTCFTQAHELDAIMYKVYRTHGKNHKNKKKQKKQKKKRKNEKKQKSKKKTRKQKKIKRKKDSQQSSPRDENRATFYIMVKDDTESYR